MWFTPSFQWFRPTIQTIHAFGDQSVFATTRHVSIRACIWATREVRGQPLRGCLYKGLLWQSACPQQHKWMCPMCQLEPTYMDGQQSLMSLVLSGSALLCILVLWLSRPQDGHCDLSCSIAGTVAAACCLNRPGAVSQQRQRQCC